MENRWGRIAILLAALASIALVIYLADGNTHYDTSAPAFGVLVTLSFCAAGLTATSRYPHNRVGTLLVVTSFAFVAGNLELTDIPILFSLGLLLDLLWIGVLVHTLAVIPSGHLDSTWSRVFAATGWAATGVMQLAKVLVNDPAVSDGCIGCPDNLFALFPSDTAFDVFTFVQALLGAAAILLGIVNFVTKWRSASGVTRKALLPPLAVGTGAFLSILAAVVLESGNEDGSVIAETIAAIAIVLLPISIVAGILGTKLSHNRVGQLAVRLRSQALDSNELEEALGWSVDDPTLRIAYWAPQLGHYLDGDGSRVDDLADGTRSRHVIEQDGNKVAVLMYDPTLDQAPGLIDAVAATAGLTLENARLRADLRGQLLALQDSRARLVDAERTERRRLERDLHDDAQQRLLALGLSMQYVRSQLNGTDAGVDEVLDEAQLELREAIRELRDLAHGLHPAVLTESGLRVAIDSLCTRGSFKIEVTYDAPDSLGASVDAVAYYVVAEALANSTKHATASRGQVTVRNLDDRLVVTVIDDGVGGADASGSGLTGLSDRVAAIGGVMKVHSPFGLGTSIVVELPCES